MLTAIDNLLLEQIADWHGMPGGAVNIRKNGEKIDGGSRPTSISSARPTNLG